MAGRSKSFAASLNLVWSRLCHKVAIIYSWLCFIIK